MDQLRKNLETMRECIHKCSSSSDEDIRRWLAAATVQIWAGNQLCSEEYAGALKEITGNDYTTAQIFTAIQCAGEPERELELPGFFRDLVEMDRGLGLDISRRFAEAAGLVFVEIAAINGDFTLAEAKAVQKILDQLIGYCDEMNIAPYDINVVNPGMITPRKPTGYYQPSEVRPAAPEPVKQQPDLTKRTSDESVTDLPQPFLNDSVGASTTSAGSEDTLESVLAELNSLIGLEQVKKDIRSLLNFLRICQLRGSRGMKVPTVSYHLVFTGNPGTGKTTVARLVAKLYYLMGILPRNQLVETDRSGLVGGYLGQTAIKTQKVIQDALGGVLFIDEAYALANDKEDSYGKEAIETILKAMEDHREELVVIVAGYDELMHKFIDSNPGLRSRFNKYFHFPDYDGESLLQITERFCDRNGYRLDPDALDGLREKLEASYQNRDQYFGNARFARNVFELAIHCQADRLSAAAEITDDALVMLTAQDVLSALEEVEHG